MLYYPWMAEVVMAFQFVTLILIFIKYSKFKLPVVIFFPWLFLLAVFNPYIAKYVGRNMDYNYMVINSFVTIKFCFFFWLLYTYVQSKKFKIILIALVLLYVFTFFYETYFIGLDYLKVSQFRAYFVGAFTILIGIIYYLIEQLSSKDIVVIQHQIIFWILVANFLYYTGFLLFKIGQYNQGLEEQYFYIYNLPPLVTLIMNIVLIIGLLWKQKVK